MIQVMNAIYGGERFEFDGHEIVDKGSHLPGFLLNKDGRIKASDVEISNSAVFDTELQSGPLRLSKEAPRSVIRAFNPGASATELSGYVRGGTLSVTGQFNGADINRLRVDIQSTTTGSQDDTTTTTRTRVYARYMNGAEVLIADGTTAWRYWIQFTNVATPPNIQIIATPQQSITTTNTLLLQNILTFRYMETGFTMKLSNIPDYEPNETGTVWRDGNTLKIK